MLPSADLGLKDKVAIVTGSARNIGKGIATELARCGAKVVVNAHRGMDRLEKVAQEIRDIGGDATPILADVSKAEDVNRMVDETVKKYGKVDIIVSNVAIRPYQAFLDITLEDWNKIISTNLTPAFLLTKAVMPLMLKQKFGRLIYISGDDGFFGNTTHRAHNATCKSGLHGFAKAIAREFGESNITANTIAPGMIDTERDWSQYPHVSNDRHDPAIALRRWGTTTELAGACVFLASSYGAYTTGHLMHVNGGSHMY